MKNTYDKLKSKNNWIVQMMLAKNAVKPYITIIDSNNPNLATDGLTINIIGKSKVLYTSYNSSVHVTFSSVKWNRRLGVQDLEIKEICKQKIERIEEIKIKEFNYKILNNILPCGVNLKQWRLIDDVSYIFCQHAHDIPHLLFSCNLTNILWNTISTILGIGIDVEAIIGLTNNLELNNILLILGYSIYKYWLVYKDETTKGNVMVHNI